MHAEPSGVPDLAFEPVDDGFPVFGMILIGAIEQKRLPPIHPRRGVPGRMGSFESSEDIAVRMILVPRNMLSNSDHDEADGCRYQSPSHRAGRSQGWRVP